MAAEVDRAPRPAAKPRKLRRRRAGDLLDPELRLAQDTPALTTAASAAAMRRCSARRLK